MKPEAKRIYQFGPFCMDGHKRLLLRNGQAVSLPSKAFDVLLLLVQHNGEVLEKDELMNRVWPDQIVEEANLTVNMSAVRKALGESPNEHRYIVTVPGRGYQFVSDVTRPEDEPSELILEERTMSQVVIEDENEEHYREEERVTQAVRGFFPTTTSTSRRRIPSLTVLAVAVLVIGLSIAAYYLLTKGQQPSRDIKSVAVLPFKSLNLDANDEYLGLGIADDLITRLSNIKQIIVRPTTAVLKYSGPEQDAAAAGRELGVDGVLVSSIRRSGDRVRVTVQLVNVANGAPMWAQKFDEDLTDIFKMQDHVSEQVAAALVPRLTGDETKLLSKHYTENSEAHQLYMIGRYHWTKADKEGWNKAIGYFNRSIEKDPNYALAYTGLADTYVSLALGALPNAEAIPKARDAAMKALQLDDTLAEAHISLARIKEYYDWEWSGAELEFKRAIELDPNSALAHQEYGQYLAHIGRSDEAIAQARHGLELDPLSFQTNAAFVWALICDRQYDTAIEQCRKVLEIDPNYAWAYYWMGVANQGKGTYDESIAELQKAISLARENPGGFKAKLGQVYGFAGRRDDAEKILAELKELFKQRGRVIPALFAIVYIGLGENDQAFAWLEKSYQERERSMVLLKTSPTYEALHSDPRCAEMLRRIGLRP
jgi:DNA-binding winged helix-turn-helix (wHTH) protein/TolB-like protein/Tfp pilus assembly protein PilF